MSPPHSMAEVRISRHGPFERIILSRQPTTPAPGLSRSAALSVYRIGGTLIDSGSSLVTAALVAALEGTPIDRIVLTHQHEDHAGGLAGLRRAWGAVPVYCPRPHVPIVAAGASVPPHRESYWGQPEAFADLIPYDPGEVFELRGLVLETVATPGHTPGHVAIHARWGSEVFVLSGDLFLSKRHVPAWFESAADEMAASQRKLASFGDGLRLLPTHGKTHDDGAATLNESADLLDREADRVREAASGAGTDDLRTVTRLVYGGDDPLGRESLGEISRAAFVRSVLDPVRSLPASPLADFTA
jgi:glyoxylase-like metal-dependent hydrolase (beta-lactamase superfamily II)